MKFIAALCVAVAVLVIAWSSAPALDTARTTLTPPAKKTITQTEVFTDTAEPDTETPVPTRTETEVPTSTQTATDEPTSTFTPVPTETPTASASATVVDTKSPTKTKTKKDKDPKSSATPTATVVYELPKTGMFDGKLPFELIAIIGVTLAGVMFLAKMIRRSMQ